MAYDRFDPRGGPRDRNPRWSDDRDFRSHDRNDRGWLERAGDQIASWFGDEDDGRGRPYGERDRGDFRSSGASEDRGRFWRDRSWDDNDFERDDRRRQSFGQPSSERVTRRDRSDDRLGYRPITGDYGRSEQFYAGGGSPRGSYGREERRFTEARGTWDREQDRSSASGARDRSRDFDPHYRTWRDRQVESLDRDYDEYSRERQSRFDDDFAGWREQRQTKRQLLGQVREHMEVVGNDNGHVGTVDRVAGDRLILTKSDPEAGGSHHSLTCSELDRIEDDRVILNLSADHAKKRWRDENRGRALFEREDQGEAGPHVLDRSFEGTYR